MSLDYTKFCHKLKIVNRTQETEDSVSLVLDIPAALKDKFKYRAGQFVTFFMHLGDKTISRSYSLSSSPDTDISFKVSVKLVPGGSGSTFLVQTAKVGDELWTTPPAGFFCLPKDFKNNNVAFFAGGSGITPVISLIKTVLRTTTASCALFFQNRDEKNILFHRELTDLERANAGRFSVMHMLSKPSSHWGGLKGRCSNLAIQHFLKQTKIENPSMLHFLCGPDGFMKTVTAALDEMGVDRHQVHFENFGTGAEHITIDAVEPTMKPAATTTDKIPADGGSEIWIGDKSTRANPEEIEAVIDGETHTVKYKGKVSVLETLLEAGLNPPYSCMDGACMACMGKVEGGLVYQKDQAILSDDNVEASECLTCQAKPASKKIRINYNVF